MLIKNMMEDLGEGATATAVPIPNVSASPASISLLKPPPGSDMP
jgi:hypothetical protein